MEDNRDKNISKIVFSSEIERSFAKHKRKDKNFFAKIKNQIVKICREPNLGKPLRYALKNRRRVHVDSYVIIYEFSCGELRFLDFDHHDKIYKKYKN